jgi:hypothetical protein
LQYEGHSVTVVGVEYGGDRGRGASEVVNLLVFDPRHRGDQLRSAPLLPLPGRKGAPDLGRLRRAAALLHAKDTQLVLCTTAEGCGPVATSGGRTVAELSVVTACEEAVARHRRKSSAR